MGDAKPREECDFTEPWSIYADRDEPWKDYELLLKLENRLKYQYEIADALGTSPSTVSYWLDKAHNEYQPEPDNEKLKCAHFEVCGHETPGVNNDLCIVCLDLMRHNQRQASKYKTKGVDPDDFDSMAGYIEALYDEYPDLVSEREDEYERLYEDDDESDEVARCEDCGSQMAYSEELDETFCTNCGSAEEVEG